MKTLFDLYKSHTGKVSDKWALYLREYDRLFAPYRNQAISMLEIGIQNGGSLEIWSQYFPNAKKFVGCDINPDCAKLAYADTRIAVVVGDATAPETQAKVLDQSANFDLIIEDGSHKSSDIVKAFARYFPALKPGGLFVAEDLHCSYWQEYEGGIFHPYSSITFFKHLADMVNHEHWGVEKGKADLIAGFKNLLDVDFDESILGQIGSVEFINSICAVRKNEPSEGLLGGRVIAGSTELVAEGHLPFAGTQIAVPNQALNTWSSLPQAPAETYEINRFEIEHQRYELKAKSTEVDDLNLQISKIINSRSWKVTAPLRTVCSMLKVLKNNDIQEAATSLQIQESVRLPEAKTDLMCTSSSFQVLSGLEPKTQSLELKHDKSILIAFYLPQYHRVAENSEWWGPGFTEWTNVVKGKPNFDDHYQPHLPRELGFYDLSNVEVMREQAEMAKLYGIGAFCFYYYWFSGRRILELPIDNFLNSDIDMPYCLCWANENWTRTWDGDTKSVLLEQKYLESDPKHFISSVLPHFEDRRYLRVDDKPLLVVYRAKHIPNVLKVFEIWRETVKEAGFKGLHIAVVDFYDIVHPDEVGADALIEFPPHKFNGPNTVPDRVPEIKNSNFHGGIVDYAKVMAQSANRQMPDFTLYRGIVPSWDNTARRQNNPTILYGASPVLFEQWLRYVRAYTRGALKNRSDNFIFINAWNEWGEGCHLEPDHKYGLKYLEAVSRSSWYEEKYDSVDAIRKKMLEKAAESIIERGAFKGSQNSFCEVSNRLESVTPISWPHNVASKLRNCPRLFLLARSIYKKLRFIWS